MTTKDYSNGKIYKIEPLNGEEGDVYIGSTTKKYLSQRMTAHRNNYKVWKNGKSNKCLASYLLFDKYGVEGCIMVLLESVNAKSLDELKARERFYITNISCMNKAIPLRTVAEYKRDKKEEIKLKDEIYRKKNKEVIKLKDEIYRKKNKEVIKLKASVPFECVCGSICGHGTKSRHFKSLKHIAFINK
jgi:adenylate kinase family enzyme